MVCVFLFFKGSLQDLKWGLWDMCFSAHDGIPRRSVIHVKDSRTKRAGITSAFVPPF